MEHESLRIEEVTNAIIKIFNPLTPGSEMVKNAPTTMYGCCRTNRILNLKKIDYIRNCLDKIITFLQLFRSRSDNVPEVQQWQRSIFHSTTTWIKMQSWWSIWGNPVWWQVQRVLVRRSKWLWDNQYPNNWVNQVSHERWDVFLNSFEYTAVAALAYTWTVLIKPFQKLNSSAKEGLPAN